ncbi:hypothetical protein N032_27070 [Pseudomonas syringae pv. pisi str. PP1]|uniref:hypothetical protein n=1 Tax=Pseudomonas syringae TaxID=317 RepID=UPI000467465D|nr:hypothetical protein [Pseudomonas syringae]AZG89021.1 hypothetical protein N032_27070 [Pseudomonas syringae pv. pisi str. PP1]RMM24789.1 TonB-dependent receptor [Pseudomonas syringae pv. pisi]UZS62595.1 hypothetical protein OQB64_26140 [Pseudomonas syringae]
MISPLFQSRRAVTTLCLLACGAGYANASEQVGLAPSTIKATALSQDAEHLGSVTHSGSRLSLTALQTPASTSSLDGDEVSNLFDRQYAASQYNEGQQWILGEPRSLYVTADLSF